ncbi:Reverse transcriptase (RNA-dependent DNA polymerase) [Fragilaria crotonensis]|nr:Reverse transcriptase (RNA-dependent DNA polymerase) [Fragilaria crotonensis]
MAWTGRCDWGQQLLLDSCKLLPTDCEVHGVGTNHRRPCRSCCKEGYWESNAAIDSKIGDALQDAAADGMIEMLLPVNADLLEDHDDEEVAETESLRSDQPAMVFDDTEPRFDETRFRACCDWSELYPGAEEAVPKGMPAVRGRSVIMSCFVNADHAGCRVTRRSHTGVIIFVNRAPIMWFSKRQNTVESSTFGFVAMRNTIEMIEGLRYRLRMMGVGIDGPACNVFCDNNAVVVNNSISPESMLKKKNGAVVNNHCTQVAIAAGVICVAKEDTATNIADILTKCLPGPTLREPASRILW